MPLKERLTPGRVPTEFDKFADTYADLLKDPIRDRFAGSGDTFFYSRKLNVLSAFLKQIIVRRAPVDANAKLLTPSVSRRLVNRAWFTVMRTQHFPYLPEMLFARMGWFEKSLATIRFGGRYAVFCRKGDGKPTFAY
jgi:hypothetical protein